MFASQKFPQTCYLLANHPPVNHFFRYTLLDMLFRDTKAGKQTVHHSTFIQTNIYIISRIKHEKKQTEKLLNHTITWQEDTMLCRLGTVPHSATKSKCSPVNFGAEVLRNFALARAQLALLPPTVE